MIRRSRCQLRMPSRLAAWYQTSETTVVRFGRSLGRRGDPEFWGALTTAVGRTPGRPAGPARRHRPGGLLGRGGGQGRFRRRPGDRGHRCATRSRSPLDGRRPDQRRPACRLDGVGASGFVALDLRQKLHRIGYALFAWLDPNVSVTSASLLGPDDVAVGISHTGASLDTMTALEEAQLAGATTVAITQFPHSPLARLADDVLTTAARETTFRSGAMASRVA